MAAASLPLVPKLVWSQHSSATDEDLNYIFLIVTASSNIIESTVDCDLSPKGISVTFTAESHEGGEECDYAFVLDFFSEVIPEHIMGCSSAGSLEIYIFTEKGTLKHWPRLSNAEDDPLYIAPEGGASAMLDINEGGRSVDDTRVDQSPEQAPESTSDEAILQLPFFLAVANGYFSKFKRAGTLEDLYRGVTYAEWMARIVPDDHLDQPTILNLLHILYLERFKLTGQATYANNAIVTLERLVRTIPDDHPKQPQFLQSFAYLFMRNYEMFNDPASLHQWVPHIERAAKILPVADPHRATLLHKSAIILLQAFSKLGHFMDIVKALSYLEQAIAITPDDAEMRKHLTACGLRTLLHFELPDGREDRAVDLFKKAVEVLKDSEASDLVPLCLFNMGETLYKRFEESEDLSNLEIAIAALEEAMRLFTENDSLRNRCLSKLAAALLRRFGQFRDIKDVDKAVLVLEDALQHTTVDHPDRPKFYCNLGIAFTNRYHMLKEIEDLENAISNHRVAVRLTSENHEGLPTRLVNLGGALAERFRQFKERADLDGAILYLERAARVTPDGHPAKLTCLNNLSSTLYLRYQLSGDILDIEMSIKLREDNMKMVRNSNMAQHLHALGNSYYARFGRVGDIEDFDKAILIYEQARDLLTDDDPSKPQLLLTLGHGFWMRWDKRRNPSDIQQAIAAFVSAARSPVGLVAERCFAASVWAWFASRTGPEETSSLGIPSVLEAYTIALDLLPQVAWLGRSVDSRYKTMTGQADNMPCNAAAAALTADDPQKALQWLEQGRSVVWGQTLRLRTPFDNLRTKNRELADRLTFVAEELDRGGVVGLDTNGAGKISPEQVKVRQHQLADEWDGLVRRVRTIEGFEGFLQPKQFSELQQSARAGFVVVLNVSESRCDALIISPEPTPLRHVPLDQLSYEQTEQLHSQMRGMLHGLGRRARDVGRSTAHECQGDDQGFKRILGKLWTLVVKPVIDALALQRNPPHELPRIWWCPTGPLAFLPIHAAGLYRRRDPISLADFAISSFTPTLSALLTALQQRADHPFKFLAVAQPETPNEQPLPGTVHEIKDILRKAENADLPARVLEGVEGTVAAVLTAMEECSWVHLACHGVQDPLQPTNSGLLLADGKRLDLSEIIRKRLPHADFAFLSACQTATGDDQLPEEAIHLAAGMLMAGYRSVVATMWSISDDDAPCVADDVYSRLFGGGGQPDSAEAARALHFATQRLRAKYDSLSFARWVPFIHVGV